MGCVMKKTFKTAIQRKMKSEWYGLLCITALLLLTSCAGPSISTTMLMPARYHEASRLKDVAVLPFDGSGGSEFASEIEGTLASVTVGDKLYFTIVDRAKLEKILDQEVRLSQSGITDPATLVKVGKAVGAKGVYTGVIAKPQSEVSDFTEGRTKCAYEETYTDHKGKQRTRCAKWTEYSVSCKKRVAVFAFTPKLIEVESGKILYSTNVSGSATDAICSDGGRPLMSESEVVAKAKQPTLHQFKTDVAPYYVTISIKLMDSTDGITSDAAKERLKQGIAFAVNNRLDRGCELWGEAITLIPNAPTPTLLYNLGICSEITGDIAQALDLYKKADRLLVKPDDRVTASLARVKKRFEDQKKLQ